MLVYIYYTCLPNTKEAAMLRNSPVRVYVFCWMCEVVHKNPGT